jgi:hypothetical protein
MVKDVKISLRLKIIRGEEKKSSKHKMFSNKILSVYLRFGLPPFLASL